MNRLRDLNWRRIILGCILIALVIFMECFWKRPLHDDDERYVQSNLQTNGKWIRREVTGADLNQAVLDGKPLEHAIAGALALFGLALILFELRQLRR